MTKFSRRGRVSEDVLFSASEVPIQASPRNFQGFRSIFVVSLLASFRDVASLAPRTRETNVARSHRSAELQYLDRQWFHIHGHITCDMSLCNCQRANRKQTASYRIVMISWPGQFAENRTQALQYRFWRILHVVFLEDQQTWEGCGCLKLSAGKVVLKVAKVLKRTPSKKETPSQVFRDREIRLQPVFQFLASGKEHGAGKIGPAFRNVSGFYLGHLHNLLEFFWACPTT